MGPSFGEVLSILIAIITPAFLIFYMAKRWFTLKEKRIEVEALIAGEKAALVGARSNDFEARLATLERIVTDAPMRLSSEIDALAIGTRTARQKDLA